MRQKSEDLQQEALNMKKSIYEFQEKIRSLQRLKCSLEQNAFFRSTEVEDLKEELKITQKKDSMEHENICKSIFKGEVASK